MLYASSADGAFIGIIMLLLLLGIVFIPLGLILWAASSGMTKATRELKRYREVKAQHEQLTKIIDFNNVNHKG